MIARCRAGDELAYEALVRRYTARCARLAGRFLAGPEEVADVVQDAFVSAFVNLDRYDSRRPFWHWLARMVVNRAIDRLRSAQHRLERASGTLGSRPSGGPSPDDAAADAEERQRVRRVLDTLPERYRTLLVLREMEGMSATAIAEVLNRPAATVRWRLFKARRLFRDAWRAQEQG